MAKAKKKLTQSKKAAKPAAANQRPKKTEKKLAAQPAKKPAATHQTRKALPEKPGKKVNKAAAPKGKGPTTDEFLLEENEDNLDTTETDEIEGVEDAEFDTDEDTEAAEAEADASAEEEEELAADDEDDDDEAPAAVASADDEDVVLTDAEGNRYCRARDCDQIAIVDAYCRYHYLLFWKKIQVRKKILDDGKLERYVEELTARYPDKFLEMIRRDLRTEKDFQAAIHELELDESGLDNEYEEDTQSFVDEIRGIGGGNESEAVEDEF